jgi:probable rRNA maturation factor
MHTIIIQLATDNSFIPKKTLLRKWAKAALKKNIDTAEVTLRVVGTGEMTELNTTYRHKKGPTNVLSFPFSLPEEVTLDIPILGDIVICADVVNREAQEQGKTQEAHWAHMIVHGIFHLLGYDHEEDIEAEKMEALEIEVMKTMGYANPYETGDNIKHYD